MTDKQLTWLALGDSYTIGTDVPIIESYPYQAAQRLRKAGLSVCAPEMMARAGWTTDELAGGISAARFLHSYDIVSLLIGVNNEYRGRSAGEYEGEFEQLLEKAIHFAGEQPGHVFVLSIPDWSVTPFAQAGLPDAKGRDQSAVSREIDAFNAVNLKISGKLKANYIDITPHTRSTGADPGSLASDLLHPSGKEYSFWAQRLAEEIRHSMDSPGLPQQP